MDEVMRLRRWLKVLPEYGIHEAVRKACHRALAGEDPGPVNGEGPE